MLSGRFARMCMHMGSSTVSFVTFRQWQSGLRTLRCHALVCRVMLSTPWPTFFHWPCFRASLVACGVRSWCIAVNWSYLGTISGNTRSHFWMQFNKYKAEFSSRWLPSACSNSCSVTSVWLFYPLSFEPNDHLPVKQFVGPVVLWGCFESFWWQS